MALLKAVACLGSQHRAGELCAIRLRTTGYLVQSAADVQGLMPYLFTRYPNFETDDAVWEDFLLDARDVARHCTTYTQFVFAVDESNTKNIVECILDTMKLVLPVAHSVSSKTACPNCGNKTLYEMGIQTQSFDEECTIVRKCMTCDL